MRKHDELDFWKMGRLLAATLFLAATLLGSAAVHAACTNDLDCDGLLDTEETTGIPIPTNFVFLDANGAQILSIPPCPVANTPYPERQYCLDPSTPDVFVVLSRNTTTGSKIPADPWKFVKLPKANGGLGVAVHELKPVDATQLDTTITRDATGATRQNAAWISESLALAVTTTTPQDLKLGLAPHTTPNNGAYGTVYTKRIENVVLGLCTANVLDANCKDSGGTTGKANVTALYIQHTLAHELGHMLYLNTVFNTRYDGWHYKSGSGYILDQSVSSSSSGGKVTFNITKLYTPADQTGAALK